MSPPFRVGWPHEQGEAWLTVRGLPNVQGDSSFIIVRSESWMRCALQAVVTSRRVRGNKKRREMELILLSGEPLAGPQAMTPDQKMASAKKGKGRVSIRHFSHAPSGRCNLIFAHLADGPLTRFMDCLFVFMLEHF